MKAQETDMLAANPSTTDEDAQPMVPVRERILQAAVQLIQAHGVHAMTQARVCEIAGVRHSHLTYYFPTRVKLLKEVVMRGSQSVLDLLDGPDHVRATTTDELRAALAEFAGDRRLPRMMVAVYVASDEEASLKPWLDKFHMNGMLRFKRALNAIGLKPPQRALEAFLTCFVGTLHTDYAASSEPSQKRSKAIIMYAFDQLIAACRKT